MPHRRQARRLRALHAHVAPAARDAATLGIDPVRSSPSSACVDTDSQPPRSPLPLDAARPLQRLLSAAALAAATHRPVPLQDFLKKKYLEERDKRLDAQTAKGQEQYVSELADNEQWKHLLVDPYVEEKIEREPIQQEMEVLCIGAGFGGLLAAARCRMAGVEVCLMEKGAGVGGTWYWNQYPDAACDVEGYSYMPLLEETDYMPERKYAKGPEILAHCDRILTKYSLHDKIFYQTVSTGCDWDEETGRWTVTTDRGDTFTAKYVINSTGVKSMLS